MTANSSPPTRQAMSAERTTSRTRSARLGEDAVAGEMPDAVVDRLEVVEVEDDEREAAVVAVRAGDLAGEGLVEVAPVVQARQRVEVGELARFPEAAGVLDRRAGPRGELLELADLLLAEFLLRRAGEDRHQSERRRLARERHRDPGSDRVAVRGESARRRSRTTSRSREPRVPWGWPVTDWRSASSAERPRLATIGWPPGCGASEMSDASTPSIEPAASSTRVSTSSRSIEPASSPSIWVRWPSSWECLEGAGQLADHVVHARLEIAHDLGQLVVVLGERRTNHWTSSVTTSVANAAPTAARAIVIAAPSRYRSSRLVSPMPQVPGRPGLVSL